MFPAFSARHLRSLGFAARVLQGYMAVLLVASTCFVASHTQAREVNRVIFDEGIYWAKPPAALDVLLDRVSAAGFNTYIPCIWHGQGAIWNSRVVDLWFKNPQLALSDPLRLFVEKAHKRGIRVFPCFTLMARQHTFYPQFTTKARPGMFDVHDRDFREMITDAVLEVVRNYDIDGINLDYIRAGQVCFSSRCREQYKQFSGRNLLHDIGIHKVNAEARHSIVSWQRQAVRSLLEGIVTRARKIRPNLIVTVDAAPWSDSVIIEGQDSITWANDNLVDYVFSMNYQPELPWQTLKDLRAGLSDAEKLVLMIANYSPTGKQDHRGKPGISSKQGPVLCQDIERAMAFNPAQHYAVYIYSMLNDEQVEFLRRARDAASGTPDNGPHRVSLMDCSIRA